MGKLHYDFVISIGQNCFVSRVLQRNNLRFFSSPLDWLQIDNYDCVINILKNKFKNFFNKEDLIFKGLDTNSRSDVYYNKYICSYFIHNFPANSKAEFDHYYDKSLKKYNYRIERLLKKFKNAKVCLIWIESKLIAPSNKTITNDVLSNDIEELNEIYKNDGACFDIFYIRHDDSFSIHKFEIDNRICTLNNTPINDTLGNIDLAGKIILNRAEIPAKNRLKCYLFKIKKLIKLCNVIDL